MKIGEAFPSKYLKASNLGVKEWELVISHIEMENMGEGEAKPVVYFSNAEKGMVLNKTNAEMISLMYGDETDAWSGQKITLKADKTQFGGRIVDCIRVIWKQHAAPPVPTPAKAYQAEQARQAAAEQQAPAPDPLDDEIPF